MRLTLVTRVRDPGLLRCFVRHGGVLLSITLSVQKKTLGRKLSHIHSTEGRRTQTLTHIAVLLIHHRERLSGE